MDIETNVPYINQPIPVPEDGKAFRVCYPDGHRTPLMTKEEAQERVNRSGKQYLQRCIEYALAGIEVLPELYKRRIVK